MPQRLDLLARHHNRLLEIMSTAGPLITATSAGADLEALAFLRQEMTEALAAYQRFVHEAIYAPLAGAAQSPAGRDALALKLGCIEVQLDYDRFRQRWARRDALASWSEYRLSAAAMMKRVRDHVAQARLLSTSWAPSAAVRAA